MTTRYDSRQRAAAASLAPASARVVPPGDELLDESRGLLGLGRSLTFPYPQYRASDEFRSVYFDHGDGPRTIVFLHGLGANFTHWEYVIRGLGDGYRLMGLDMVGCGSTGKPHRAYDVALLRDHLIGFLERHEVRRCVLAGHSLGGAVSLATALARPDLVEGLVLADPAGLSRFPAWMRLGAPLVLHEQLLFSALRLGHRFILNLVFVDRAEENPYVEHFEANALRDDVGFPNLRDFARVAATLCRDAVELDFGPRLAELTMPVLAVWGDHDGMLTVPGVVENLARIPRIRTATIPRCGHMPIVERPGELLTHMERFLATL